MNHQDIELQAMALTRRVVQRWPILVALSWLILCVSGSAYAEGEPPRSPTAAVAGAGTDPSTAILESFRNDAALADVCFVDRRLGWAVGDRGVIWHTDDGGATWRQQASEVSCRLNSVFFVDGQCGWAVGGDSRPYSQATRGVVLRTVDAGQNWTALPQPVLRRLARVKFFDHDRGIALGEATPIYPSGVFITQDGGQSWQPLPADQSGGWLAGDFWDWGAGAVAGGAGRFATLARRQIIHSPLATYSLHSYRAMRLAAPTGGWLVGDGGVVMTTGDLGRSWQSPPTDLPDFATNHFDFHALAVHGPHVWVAGSPGTRVFHSPDGGQNWHAHDTGQYAPLRALWFIDPEHGWAVGDLGAILASDDGGRSWHVRRCGGQRAALLGIFATATDVPLELLADAGAADAYIAAVNFLHGTATEGNADAQQTATERARDALLLAGAAAADFAWRFPLPPDDLALAPADLLAALNRANDGRATEQVERHLVRTLRMWRPDILVTHHPALESTEPRAAIVVALILRAIEAAADPARHIDLTSHVGLPPWQVKKVYGVLPPGGLAHFAESAEQNRGLAHFAQSAEQNVPVPFLVTGRFSPWLGTTLADFVSPARHLLSATHTPPPDKYQFELLRSEVAESSGPRGLFSGIALEHDSDARRPQGTLPANDLEDLRRMATRRRHLEELLERTEGNAAWAGQMANLTEDLTANDGGQLLIQLADGYRAAGRLDLAADTYYALARRYPDHPLVDRALVWLVQFYASSEAAHQIMPRGPAHFAAGTIAAMVAEQNVPVPLAPANGLSRDDRLRRAVQLAEYLRLSRPALYTEPALRFAEIAAQRQLGFPNPAQRYYLAIQQLPKNDPWRQCAETEEWLATPADQPPPKLIGACRPTVERPHLDGLLDESFWDTADHMPLRGRDRLRLRAAAEFSLAYDREYLYIAVRCDKAPGAEYRPDDRPRPRDADLTEHDRVTLRFDVDRDFSTAFELTVDARGWTHEACWGDANWNPDWYVAADGDETTWTIEAAVPLTELVDNPPAARQVWAIAARRTIPRLGYQSWAGAPADANSPAQFGLIIFE